MQQTDHIQHRLLAAQAEALRVGDSPLRADQLAAKLPAITGAVEESALT